MERKIRRAPFFSVVIPTYNRKRRVIKAIKSVLKQTCRDYEIIVVDDGSRDRTKNKVRKKFGTRVRYIYQKNNGPSSARNRGIRHARGRFIALLDSDDRFLRHKLELNKRFLERRPECKFLHNWYYDIRRGNKTKIQKPKSCKNLTHFRHSLYRRKFTLRTSTAVIHRDCFRKVGYFNTKYRFSQDWDMWLRLAAHYYGYCQKIPLVKYYRTKKKRNHRKIRKNHQKIRRKIMNKYKWSGAYLRKLDRKYKKKG